MLAQSAFISPGASIEASSISIGEGARIESDVEIQCESFEIGAGCYIGKGSKIVGRHVRIGRHGVLFPEVELTSLGDVVIGPWAKFSKGVTVRSGSIQIGCEFWINPGAEIGGGGWRDPANRFEAGDRCHVGRNTHVNVAECVVMGNGAGVGMDCTLATHGQWQPYVYGYPRPHGPIRIGDLAVLYSRIIVSPGVQIGRLSSIGAGAVVTGDVPDYAFAAGVPARVIRVAGEPALLAPRVVEAFSMLAAKMNAEVVVEGANRWIAPAGGPPVYLVQDAAAAELPRDAIVVLAAHGGYSAPAESTVFNLFSLRLSGPSSAATESIRAFWHSMGVRFAYHGYERHPLTYEDLIARGLT
jgi:acetyltransferase-like isoleucine patch superfamily enzyme